ncbi:Lamin Tail Domain [Lishizhenia tianjinensis]|uniref:Lamin Tail Domain n=1 Tax=Lishizhenia tianjinensis TaxID=477690 RepID=A0A1I7BBE8_9FLAO|nr:CotH kinase family protein [Lishizhenia tianjinensis]SFT84478.1 Lamin Tail Domain [Lishizhenia tianjinensis]
MKALTKKISVGLGMVLSFLSFGQIEFEARPKPGNYPDLNKVSFVIPEGSKAYFTTDGTRPSSYSQRLNSTESIVGNTCFSIALYDVTGKRKDTVLSYITDFKHDLPIISIVSNPANFFDSAIGIFEKGCCADTIDPYMGANFWKDWEREINIEFFDTNGVIGFNQRAGVKIFGGYSKSMPQKSLAIYARSKYGQKKFEYPIFPQLEINKYKNFVLRNGGGDMLAAHARDVFATQLVKETGIDYQEYRPCAVYINGRYWGLYNIREKINEHYLKAHYGYDKDSVIIMRHVYERQHGSPYDYRNTLKFIQNNSLTDPEALAFVSAEIDIDNYILYNILETYTANGDAGGNIRYYKSTSPETKWKWIFFDLDLGLNTTGAHEVRNNTVEDFTTYSNEQWPNPSWSTLIIRKILEHDSLKMLYINQFCDLLNTTFDSTRAMTLADKLKTEQQNEIDAHLKRWGIYRSRYDRSWQYIKDFAEQRPRYLYQFIQERFELAAPVNVKVVVDKKAGKVDFNTLELKQNYSGQYFPGIKLKVVATPRFDYVFKGWKGRSEVSPVLYVDVNENTVFEPIFEKRPKSDWRKFVVVSEINAAQAKDDDSEDFIEIYNLKDTLIDISGWIVKDEEDKHHFVVPQGTRLEPHGFVVLVQNKKAYLKRYPDANYIVGDIGFGFKAESDKIRLYDADTNRIVSISLKKIGIAENDTSNLVLARFTYKKEEEKGYLLETPNPGAKSKAQLFYEAEERQKEFYRQLFFYAISSTVALGTLIFILVRRKRRRKLRMEKDSIF